LQFLLHWPAAHRRREGVGLRLGDGDFAGPTGEVDNWRCGRRAVLPTYRQGPGGKSQTITLGLRHRRCDCSRRPAAARWDGTRSVIDSTIWAIPPFLAQGPGSGCASARRDGVRIPDSFIRGQWVEGSSDGSSTHLLGDRHLHALDAIERLWEISIPLLDHPPPRSSGNVVSWGPDSGIASRPPTAAPPKPAGPAMLTCRAAPPSVFLRQGSNALRLNSRHA